MIASQFNLDQRLAELQQSRTIEYADQAAGRESASPVSRVGAILRSLVGSTPAGRPVRIAAPTLPTCSRASCRWCRRNSRGAPGYQRSRATSSVARVVPVTPGTVWL